MDFLQTIFLAILVAFLGFSPPGMLNMTALKISLEHPRQQALRFVLGASSVIFIQALIAVTFAKFLAQNPALVHYLSYAAIGVFLLLAYFFYRQARRKIQLKLKGSGTQSYWAGFSMAWMNMLAIPFFLGYSTILEAQGVLETQVPHNWLFALGAMAGAFVLFMLYVSFARLIQQRVQFIARNINYILSALFLMLALTTIYSILSGG